MGERVFVTVAAAVAAAGLLAGCAARSNVASNKTQAVLVGKAQKAKPKEHMVCVKETRLGSHIARLYCMTADEYAQLKKGQKKSAKALKQTLTNAPGQPCSIAQGSGQSCSGGGGGGGLPRRR